MKGPGVLWQISVRVTNEHLGDSLGELLSSWFNQPSATYRDLERGVTTVELYLKRKPAWSLSDRQHLAKALAQCKNGRLSRGEAPKLSRLRPENWAESWKRHFKPKEIGKKLLIRPSWSRRRAPPNQNEVVLDPGMSFGTGQHPTTGFCLEELVRARADGTAQAFLDVGTGSGILAISAAKLGYTPVKAFDLDPASVAIARGNARANHVGEAIRFECRNLSHLPIRNKGTYQVVCANLLANLLIDEKQRLAGLLTPGAVLVVAGILDAEFPEVREAYEAEGLRLIRSRRQREWRSGSFRKQF